MTDPAAGLPTPRQWVGDDPFPWPPVLGSGDGDAVVACFSVLSVDRGRTRAERPFLKLRLTDGYGPVEGRMWDGVEPFLDLLRAGHYVGVRGTIESFNEERQLRIEEMSLLRVELDDLVLFLPRSARAPERMDAELAALIDSVADPGLNQLLSELLGSHTETGRAFRMAPAAKQNHHAWLGGLLEHTLSMAHVCDMLAAHYGQAVDRDLLIAGAMLHDIGKVREIGATAGFPYTDEGKLLGHIVIGMQMVAEAAAGIAMLSPARLLLLQHLIAAHQGRHEWQSPREPRTLEALVLHYADDLDAKVAQASTLLAAVNRGWTAWDRSLGRDLLRHIPADAHVSPDDAGDVDGHVPAGEATSHDQGPEAPARKAEETPGARPRVGEPAGLETLDLFADDPGGQ